MPWTGEDTKDVFKKVIGGLLAAAILALVYAIVERVEWYYAAAIATVLVILVFLLILRFARSSTPLVEEPRTADAQRAASEQPSRSPTPPGASSEIPETKSDDEKVLKKAIKAEQKKRKKEAKAREKDDD